MAWPNFHLGEAINQAISAAVTVGGVFLGGWLAFSLGVKQLRKERAIDRRVESQEKLLASIEEYRGILRLLISLFEAPIEASDHHERMCQHAIGEATEKGRELQRLISLADLYGMDAEKPDSRALRLAQLQGYMASWMLSENGSARSEHVHTLKSVTAVLEEQERVARRRLRVELSLDERA